MSALRPDGWDQCTTLEKILASDATRDANFWNLVKQVVNRSPDDLMTRRKLAKKRKAILFHHIVGMDPPHDVIRAICEARPDGPKTLDGEYGYPFHNACYVMKNRPIGDMLTSAYVANIIFLIRHNNDAFKFKVRDEYPYEVISITFLHFAELIQIIISRLLPREEVRIRRVERCKRQLEDMMKFMNSLILKYPMVAEESKKTVFENICKGWQAFCQTFSKEKCLNDELNPVKNYLTAKLIVRGVAAEPVNVLCFSLHKDHRYLMAKYGSMQKLFKNSREEFCRKDSNGNTPLMAFINDAFYVDKSFPLPERDFRRQERSLFYELLHYGSESLRICDSETGRLPLYCAIQVGLKWSRSLRKMIEKSPEEAVFTRDKSTRLYPFMEAAVGKKADLTTVFQLLRRKPDRAEGLSRTWYRMNQDDKIQQLKSQNVELTERVRKLEKMVAWLASRTDDTPNKQRKKLVEREDE